MKTIVKTAGMLAASVWWGGLFNNSWGDSFGDFNMSFSGRGSGYGHDNSYNSYGYPAASVAPRVPAAAKLDPAVRLSEPPGMDLAHGGAH